MVMTPFLTQSQIELFLPTAKNALLAYNILKFAAKIKYIVVQYI